MISKNAQAKELQGGNNDEPNRGGDIRSNSEGAVMVLE